MTSEAVVASQTRSNRKKGTKAMNRQLQQQLAEAFVAIGYRDCPKEALVAATQVMKASESGNPETREKALRLIESMVPGKEGGMKRR